MAGSRLLLLSGSLRDASTNTALLRTVQAVVPATVEAHLFEGLGHLPHFNPDDDREGAPVAPAVADLRTRIAAADAVLFSTPEYAGALPGSFKNLLDWTVGDGGLYGKPVAWVNVAGPAAPTGGADAHASLRKVLTYTGAVIVEAACLRIPVSRAAVGDDGLIADEEVRAQVVAVLETLAAHAQVDGDGAAGSELPIACTLDAGEQVTRRDRWLALAAAALVDKQATATGVRLRYAPGDETEAELQALAAAERECCPFATWQVHRRQDAVLLDVDAAPDAVSAVRALFDLSTAA